jgi:hypothetical protein
LTLPRDQFYEKLKALRSDFRQEEIDASEVSAGPAKAFHEPDPDRVGALHENDRDRLGRCLGRERTKGAFQYHDHRYLTLNQFGDQTRQPLVVPMSPPVFDHDIPAFGVAGLTQASDKGGEILTRLFERCEVQKPDHGYRRPLRMHWKGRSSDTADHAEKFAPSHVIPHASALAS